MSHGSWVNVAMGICRMGICRLTPQRYLGGDQPGPDLGVGDRQAEEEERPGHSDTGVKT